MKVFYGKILHLEPRSPVHPFKESIARLWSSLQEYLAGSSWQESEKSCCTQGLEAHVLDDHHLTMPISKVLVLGSTAAQKLMKQLHFMVPESALAYHYHANCKPLLMGGQLVDVEPSPASSKARNLPKDPGTRLETNRHGDVLLRRIGDPRLTFCQMDCSRARIDASTWISLTVGVSSTYMSFYVVWARLTA